MVLAVDVAEHERSDFPELLRLPIQLFNFTGPDGSIGIDTHVQLSKSRQHFQNRLFGAATRDVAARYFSYIPGLGSRSGRSGRIVGKIPIQELMPDGFAAADFTFSRAVIRDEEADTVVNEQMKIAVKVLGVAAMADDAMSVARLLVEAEGHTINVRAQFELPRVH